MLVAVGLAIAGCSRAAAPAAAPTVARATGSGKRGEVPLDRIYNKGPSFESAFQGDFATGAMFADINGDGRPDLIIANGNDMSPQSLVVFFNRCDAAQHKFSGCFGVYPDYYSADSDYNGNIAVGDIDHDGWLDVAVAVPFDKQRHTAGGGVKIYLNKQGHLELAQRLGNVGTFGCALADVNADGQLDLVVPAFSLTGAPGGVTWQPEPARIYLNDGGRFLSTPSWQTENPIIATGVAVADLNQDGWMDLAIAGKQTFVYYGAAPGPAGPVPIDPVPAWTSADDDFTAIFVDAGHIVAGRALTLAVSRGCYPGMPRCGSDFALYQPSGRGEPVWHSAPTYQSSILLLADLNADGLLELIGGQWGDEKIGAPLWFFEGRRDGYHTTPDFVTGAGSTGSSGLAVAEGLAVADTRDCATTTHQFAATATAAGAVITLAERQIAGVTSVSIAGRELASREWAFARGNNWISLAHPYAAGDALRVSYLASPVQDVAEATWNPDRGNLIYNSFLPTGRCVAGSSIPLQEKQP
jgi:hypothetical protein